MAAPNIVDVTTITAKTTANTIPILRGNLISNAPDSAQVFKINTVMVTNANTVAIGCNLHLLRTNTVYHLASNIVIPVGSTVLLLAKDNAIYLEEGDAVQSSSTTLGLHITASYEVIS